MNPADQMAANIETTELPGAVAGSDQKLDEQASLDDFQPTNHQRRPVEDLHNLLLRISHHLDYETSERATIYYRLLAIDDQTKTIISQTKRRALRAFARYVVAIFIGTAGILTWQSYGDATKQIIATRAPELGWSPEAAQTAPEAAAPKAPGSPSLDAEQVQQIALGLAALRQTVDQLAAGQDQMAREVTRLQAADQEILEKIPAPPPRPTAVPTRHTPLPPPSPRAPSPH